MGSDLCPRMGESYFVNNEGGYVSECCRQKSRYCWYRWGFHSNCWLVCRYLWGFLRQKQVSLQLKYHGVVGFVIFKIRISILKDCNIHIFEASFSSSVCVVKEGS